MKYYSLHHKAPKVSFREAVIRGIAPDKGLYFPENFTALPQTFFNSISSLSKTEIAFQAISQFVAGEIPDHELESILENVLDFDFPMVELDEHTSVLELFHGPTMAFKDVGARFMAECLGYFNRNSDQEVTILVATSGDTGGAVANGFLGVKGVQVVILYPSGKVSDIQEKQLTTLGQNITALEVEGTFDDCQNMVKTAFLDEDVNGNRKLTSANSINVARWLPQMFYYLFAYRKVSGHNRELVFSVPSGNFGNICAGMVAHKLGMPCRHFIAATNVNDTVPNFMESQVYHPKPSIATISNAMDVGNPSNFIRIMELFGNDFQQLSKILSSYSYTDSQTRNAMVQLKQTFNYIADPHGAVGYLGLKRYQEEHPDSYGIFLETAHPIKFLDVVRETLGSELSIPPQIEMVLKRKKVALSISNYQELKEYLLNS
ncbi:threonine synthase [Lentiprolixibacter aurantiacus]|uniref:Threonine synthase n=1 Tax=Lentiprolixibacter aurantiacus TaxID=2993939 RepID=A0AAE3SNS2_9FLAO|nr:threonine synthase [Lentiprolixibacter aurantiacus]MCX2719939.1 threonine synthase [Lentiprolixibacter aurantiacus]